MIAYPPSDGSRARRIFRRQRMAKDRTGALEQIDNSALAELSSALLDDSRRGIDEAAGRVAQTRADVFAKVRDLQLELGSRGIPPTSIESSQRQIAVGLIIELGTSIKGALD